MHPETLVIGLGRPAAVADGPLNVPIIPASALQAGGPAAYARDGHAPWMALEEVIGALPRQIGCEHVDDLWADLQQALGATTS